jgi:CheY-like chemotaxis protein
MAVSGVSPEQFDRAQALGAVATMAKPFSPEELLRVVSDALATTYSPPPDDLWR